MPSGTAGFPKLNRLLDAGAFKEVFQDPKRSSDACFTVLWRTNGMAESRLGLAVAKKNVRRAVDRNRVKRLIRESFRQTKAQLPGVDIVVLAKPGVAGCANRDIALSLQRHWRRLILNG